MEACLHIEDIDRSSPSAQRAKGNWKQFKGFLKEKWGDLRDDDLDRMEGRRDRLVGYLQEQTARERQEVERDIDDLSKRADYRW